MKTTAGTIVPAQRPLFPPPVGSLDNAQQAFKDKLRDGSTCPCCGRFGKIYRRKFNSKMARATIELYRLDLKRPGAWVHVAREVDYNLRGSDYGLLPAWKFVEQPMPDDGKSDGNPHSGRYRITVLGRAFVKGLLPARKYVYTYNDAVIEVEEAEAAETIWIRDALGSHFGYTELMQELTDAKLGR